MNSASAVMGGGEAVIVAGEAKTAQSMALSVRQWIGLAVAVISPLVVLLLMSQTHGELIRRFAGSGTGKTVFSRLGVALALTAIGVAAAYALTNRVTPKFAWVRTVATAAAIFFVTLPTSAMVVVVPLLWSVTPEGKPAVTYSRRAAPTAEQLRELELAPVEAPAP